MVYAEVHPQIEIIHPGQITVAASTPVARVKGPLASTHAHGIIPPCYFKQRHYETTLGLYCCAQPERSLMKIRSLALACFLSIAAVLAYAQNPDEGFQTAQVVSFE